MQSFMRLMFKIGSPNTITRLIKPVDQAYRFSKYVTIISNQSRFKSEKVSVTYAVKQRHKRPSNVGELLNYINEKKVFYLKLLTNIFHTIDFNTLSTEECVLLLQCCGASVPDSSSHMRNQMCQTIFQNLVKLNKVDTNIYHTYISICTENNVTLNAKEFLNTMQCSPDRNTFQLLMENVCQKGHINEALNILENMKKHNIEIDEHIFNYLVLAHTIQGGIESGESVMKTMKNTQVSESIKTKLLLIKGLIISNNFTDLKKALYTYTISCNADETLQIVQDLAISGNYSWLPEIKSLWKNVVTDRDFIAKLKKICIHLVHMKKPDIAMAIFEEFVTTEFEPNYGFFLLKEMLHCQVDIHTIISLAKHLKESNKNMSALEDITDVALRHEYVEVALVLLENLEHLKPHYFWPILVSLGKKEGERGVFRILRKMRDLQVKIDFETLEIYTLPFCDLSLAKETIQQFKELGITVSEVLSPMLLVLLTENKVNAAADLCKQYNVKIFGDKCIQRLSAAWGNTRSTNATAYILQKYCESIGLHIDIVGEFLTRSIKTCQNINHYQDFAELVQILSKKHLRINTLSADVLNSLCDQCPNDKLKAEIKTTIDTLLDFGLKSDSNYITHPKDMTINELECHLIELQKKRMNTRGVLRKLIQMHASLGNIQRVNELNEMCKSAGHEESPGMKSSLLHTNIRAGNLEEALNIYEDLNQKHPQFRLDPFKIVDLAKLLIENNKYTKAIELLNNEGKKRKITPDASSQRNCFNLLTSCKNSAEQKLLFDTLVKNGYCNVTNVLLGPVVRLFLNNNELEEAVNIYVECTNKYKCTPLQLELFCAVLKTENSEMLQKLIKATETVHGGPSTHTTLVCGLAENGQNGPLRKVLVNSVDSIKSLVKMRCQRWVQERKILPLKTLAKASQKLPKEVVDLAYVYECIMQIYYVNNDWKAAVKLNESLEAEEYLEDKNLETNLRKVLSKFS